MTARPVLKAQQDFQAGLAYEWTVTWQPKPA